MKRYAISIDKKNTYPKNDGQQKLVYSFDHKLECIIKSMDFIKGKNYLEFAKNVFENEGFVNMNVSANNSDKVSQVNIGTQKLSFSNISIKNNCFETIIHELAHGVCIFHYGYNYEDAHNELFVNILMAMIKEHCQLKDNDILEAADSSKVKYFVDIKLNKKTLTEKEYQKELSLYSNETPVYKKESRLKSFKSQSFIKDKNTLITFFENEKGFYLCSERQLLSFEKDLFVNPFKNKKELFNIVVLSPLFKMHRDGKVIKTGLYHSFGFCDIDKALNNNFNNALFQLKESANLERERLIQKYKSVGYKILKPKSVEQFLSIQKFFYETAQK